MDREIKLEVSILETTKPNFMILGVESHSGDEGYTEITQISDAIERYNEENADVKGEADLFYCRDYKKDSNICTQK